MTVQFGFAINVSILLVKENYPPPVPRELAKESVMAGLVGDNLIGAFYRWLREKTGPLDRVRH